MGSNEPCVERVLEGVFYLDSEDEFVHASELVEVSKKPSLC